MNESKAEQDTKRDEALLKAVVCSNDAADTLKYFIFCEAVYRVNFGENVTVQ